MSDSESTVSVPFSGYRPVVAEGARIGLMTCLLCGAAILVDPADEPNEGGAALHVRWHQGATDPSPSGEGQSGDG